MSAVLFDLILCALILGVAVAAVSGRDLFASLVFFIVFGLLVAVAWLRLEAVDVALAEAAIGAGLTGVLLLGAWAQTRAAPGYSLRPGRGVMRVAVGAGAVGVAALLVHAVLTLPPQQGLQAAVNARLAQAGAENPVTAVLLNFRGWDTLLESIVLLAALAGVWMLGDDSAWAGRPGMRQHVRPGGVLASFGRFLPPVGLLIGVYLIWAGSKQPGGAFQGGTVLAAVWLLVSMAGLLEAPRIASRGLRIALVAGPGVFLAVAVAGTLAGGFLVLPAAHAEMLLLAIEAVLALSIAVTLALLVLGPARHETS